MPVDLQQSDAELQAAQMPQYRGLKTAVIVMGVLLVVGFVVVFSTIIYRTVNLGDGVSGAASEGAAAGYERNVTLPAGARIEQVTADNDRLLVEVVEAEGARLLVVLDARRGREIGRFRLAPQ